MLASRAARLEPAEVEASKGRRVGGWGVWGSAWGTAQAGEAASSSRFGAFLGSVLGQEHCTVHISAQCR